MGVAPTPAHVRCTCARRLDNCQNAGRFSPRALPHLGPIGPDVHHEDATVRRAGDCSPGCPEATLREGGSARAGVRVVPETRPQQAEADSMGPPRRAVRYLRRRAAGGLARGAGARITMQARPAFARPAAYRARVVAGELAAQAAQDPRNTAPTATWPGAKPGRHSPRYATPGPAAAGGYASARHGTRTTLDSGRKRRDRLLVGRHSRRHPARHRPGVRTHLRGRPPAREPHHTRPPIAPRGGDCDNGRWNAPARHLFAPPSGRARETPKALTGLQDSQGSNRLWRRHSRLLTRMVILGSNQIGPIRPILPRDCHTPADGVLAGHAVVDAALRLRPPEPGRNREDRRRGRVVARPVPAAALRALGELRVERRI